MDNVAFVGSSYCTLAGRRAWFCRWFQVVGVVLCGIWEAGRRREEGEEEQREAEREIRVPKGWSPYQCTNSDVDNFGAASPDFLLSYPGGCIVPAPARPNQAKHNRNKGLQRPSQARGTKLKQ